MNPPAPVTKTFLLMDRPLLRHVATIAHFWRLLPGQISYGISAFSATRPSRLPVLQSPLAREIAQILHFVDSDEHVGVAITAIYKDDHVSPEQHEIRRIRSQGQLMCHREIFFLTALYEF